LASDPNPTFLSAGATILPVRCNFLKAWDRVSELPGSRSVAAMQRTWRLRYRRSKDRNQFQEMQPASGD
jgi:hypothetical protein